jgi:hypothetical protein
VPPGVDILAVPTYGPWAALKETVDFVRAVGRSRASRSTTACSVSAGLQLVLTRVNEMTGTRVVDLRSQTPHDF